MKFSIFPSYARSWSELLELARFDEQSGLHGIWCADHLMQQSDDALSPDEFAIPDFTLGRTPGKRIATLGRLRDEVLTHPG